MASLDKRGTNKSTSSWLYLNGPTYGIHKPSQIAFSKILPVSSVLSGAGAGAGAGVCAAGAEGAGVGAMSAAEVAVVIAIIVYKILCTNTFTSVLSDRVSAAVSAVEAACLRRRMYKTDVIDGMKRNGILFSC